MKILLALLLLSVCAAGQVQPSPPDHDSMPGMHMGHDSPQPLPSKKANPPNASASAPVYRLDELETRALKNNPTLWQSEARVRSAEGRKQQAGLWPNPTIGYFGDEISGGVGVNGGRQGGYIEQTIVLGRKLYLAQQVAGSEVRLSALAKDEQRYRVQNAVRAAYFRTLAAQEMVALAQSRVELAGQMLETVQRLQNTGARDASETMMAETELERARLAADVEQSHLRQQWENLRVVVGEPSMTVGTLAGRLEDDVPQVDPEQLINGLLNESPAVLMAQEDARRAEAAALQARRRSVPDLQLRAGLEQNFQTNEFTGRAYGLQGVAEARVELPIFNRNQGEVAAANAELERSKAERRRVELQLRQQASLVVEEYQTARMTVERYRTNILPRTHTLFEMQQQAWARMALSYPQVLLAEQSMFSAQAEYLRALENLRTNAVALSGFLLTDGALASR